MSALEVSTIAHGEDDTDSGRGLLEVDPEGFRANFNRKPFLVRHRLSGHPLFSLPRLVELSKRLPESYVAYTSGDVSISEGLYRGPRTGLSIEETIHQIEERRSWMVLKFVEWDPEYRLLLDACLDEVRVYSEPLAPRMWKREGFIFISSPGSLTPYHVDPEYNFLLQIRGNKKVSVVGDARGPALTEQELEEYYTAPSGQFKLAFKQEFYKKATAFELVPGLGVHVPVTAPHWVENGDEVSISFSITFESPVVERRAMLYATNAKLRRMGLRPAPVGRSALRDSAKLFAFRALRRAKRLLGRAG
jgi:mannose-6-phosphate isomerase-like protein (cupin superfamily)